MSGLHHCRFMSFLVVCFSGGIVIYACSDRDGQLAGPQSKPGERQLSQASPPPCYLPSEFFREYEGEDEILTLTFEVVTEEFYCGIDMLDEGIMFGDTALGYYWGMYGGSFVMIPSGARVAHPILTYEGIAYFDPPVSSIEFLWDSSYETGFRALNHFGFIIDQEIRPPTHPGGPHGYWDSLSLGASSDQIASLYIYYPSTPSGYFYMDNLRIRRKVPPGIECTPSPVMRGDPVTCDLIHTVDQVHGWEFTGTFPGPSGTATVLSSSSSASWTGQAVLSGTVTADVSMNGVPDTVTLFGNLEVLDRNWSWNSSVFDYDSAAGIDCGNWGTVYYTDDSLKLGRNTRTTNCDVGLYDPSIYSYPDSGYSAAPILDGGPNDSLWYVTDVYYFMDRGAIVNPFITPSGVNDTMTNNKDKKDCNTALGRIVVNFYEFNKFCRGDSLSLDSFYQGIYDHEGHGTGAMNGHQIRNEDAALDPANDPHTGAERIVQSSAALLTSVLSIEIQNRDMSAFAFGGDHNYVNNNWCGSVWVLKPNNKYFYAPITLPGGVCF